MTLGNISPQFHSKLSSIHLVAIANHTDIAEYGMDAVIHPFIEYIKKI